MIIVKRAVNRIWNQLNYWESRYRLKITGSKDVGLSKKFRFIPATSFATFNERDKTSLGIIRPKRVLDLVIEEDEEEWKPQWQELYQQLTLFGPPPKPLAKIPYKFSYIFECDDDDKPHRAMIEDWELGVLYLKEVDRLGNKEEAAESVRKKFYKEMCAPDRDTHFFMGTTFPYNSWVVVGVYWPKIEYQLGLGF